MGPSRSSPSDPDRPGAEGERRAALPRADRLTIGHRLRLLARRTRGRALCLLGVHVWAYHRNPEVGGPQAVYHQCRRCGTEDSPADPRQLWM